MFEMQRKLSCLLYNITGESLFYSCLHEKYECTVHFCGISLSPFDSQTTIGKLFNLAVSSKDNHGAIQ